MPITQVVLLQPGVQFNQIVPRHFQYVGAIPNAQADQPGARSSCSIIFGAVPGTRSDQPAARSSRVWFHAHHIIASVTQALEQLAYRHDTRPFLSYEGAGPPD